MSAATPDGPLADLTVVIPVRNAEHLLPACLAAADIGVAPFDTAAHAPLSLAFYWSPLKVFEYMAGGARSSQCTPPASPRPRC